MIFIKVPWRDNLLGFNKVDVFEFDGGSVYRLKHQGGGYLMKHHLDPEFHKELDPEVESKIIEAIKARMDKEINRLLFGE